MDYTREPIVESVIAAREGCKLVIRSSKGMNQEEYFLDAVELVTFGSAQFYRSVEKPKPFLIPVQDYEIVEVREPRMVLKNVGIDRSIKIGSEKKPQQPQQQHQKKEAHRQESQKQESQKQEPHRQEANKQESNKEVENTSDEKSEDLKKRQKRSHRRRGKSQQDVEGEDAVQVTSEETQTKIVQSPAAMSALLAPPPTLISETLSKYRSNDAYKQAFYEREVQKDVEQATTTLPPYVQSDEDFDEGDHIIFSGTQPKAFEEPQAIESLPDVLKEETIIFEVPSEDISFEDSDEQS